MPFGRFRQFRLLRVVLASCGYFWLVVGGFDCFWVILAGCGWFWLIVGGFGWFWVVLGGCGWFWVVVAGFGWFWLIAYFITNDVVNIYIIKAFIKIFMPNSKNLGKLQFGRCNHFSCLTDPNSFVIPPSQDGFTECKKRASYREDRCRMRYNLMLNTKILNSDDDIEKIADFYQSGTNSLKELLT